ncbi:hypothetical protein [Thalassobacillus pellis]|uniref:hypothetical protein n=1 Tax=Thalassobacillus pellis TaxID=748008 RepID=UPI00196228A9|nr:hypothetical protein [Thalassobacillus pellis]MBM7554172.1 hypothetical protein [Thalassobacillus pellis]
MESIILSLKDNKKTIPLKVERMAVYLQSQILEAYDSTNNPYFAIYYKDRFLTVVQPDSNHSGPYIEKAFRHGIIFESPHPLIFSIASVNQPIKKPGINKLLHSLNNYYSAQESVMIATFFESYVPDETLTKHIQSLYYEDRRGGKLFSCYRIIRVLEDFEPLKEWTSGLINEMELQKYQEKYEKLDTDLAAKDPLYYEKALFSSKRYDRLAELINQQERWIDYTALSIDALITDPSEEKYASLITYLNNHFNENEISRFLEGLYQHLPAFTPLHADLIHHYLNNEQIEKLLLLIGEQNVKLTKKQSDQLTRLLDKVDVKSAAIHSDMLNSLLVSLFPSHPVKASSLLHQAVTLLMKEHDLEYVTHWLQPLAAIPQAQPIIKKVNTIQTLIEDPDRQLLLGEMYYQFQYLDGAIDCFSWEMELKKNDPVPVQWLAKIYNEKGMPEEAKAYQQLYVTLASKK